MHAFVCPGTCRMCPCAQKYENIIMFILNACYKMWHWCVCAMHLHYTILYTHMYVTLTLVIGAISLKIDNVHGRYYILFLFFHFIEDHLYAYSPKERSQFSVLLSFHVILLYILAFLFFSLACVLQRNYYYSMQYTDIHAFICSALSLRYYGRVWCVCSPLDCPVHWRH